LIDAEAPVARVRIQQSLWEHCDEDLADTFANASRPFVTRATSPFQLIDCGSSKDAKISIIDRLSGTVIGSLNVPSPYSGSSLVTMSQVGHFLPLGSRAAMHGLSLLERERQKPLWTTSPRQIAHDNDQALVGPSGPTFCVFQSRRHLFVMDPGTGQLLWERTDIDPQSGLSGDPVRGIFGDEQALVVMGANHTSYTIYGTATGEELRHGELEKAARHTQERRTFGRNLLYFTADGDDRRIRIWDPLTDRCLYERFASVRFLWKDTGEDEVVTLGVDGALHLVDGRTGTVRFSTVLNGADVQEASQLIVYRDFNRY
jgi:hypothetical protein